MLKIAVSGINAVDNPGPGTGIMRALKESPLAVRTIGLAYDAMEPGIYMDGIVDKSYIIPYPSGERKSFTTRLKYIHSMEKLDIIIPALDAELPVFMDIATELESWGIKMLIPDRHKFNLRQKMELNKLADAIDIKSPRYFSCTSYDDLHRAVNDLGLPCMIKGPFYEAFKAVSLSEAEGFFIRIANKWGYPIIAQQFIQGEEYDVVGCGDGEGGHLGLFAIKKMTTTSLGKVWNAISIKNEELHQTADRLLTFLKWRGGFELEVLIDHQTQAINLIEINPRFPAWVYMSAACGVNLPERLVRFLMGMDYERTSDYRSGRIMIRYTNEIIKDIKDFENISSLGELENNIEEETC